MPSTGRFKHIARFITVGKHLPTFLGMLITLSVLWLQLSAPTFVEDFIQRPEYLVYDQRLDIMPKACNASCWIQIMDVLLFNSIWISCNVGFCVFFNLGFSLGNCF